MENSSFYTSLSTLLSEDWDKPIYTSYGIVVSKPQERKYITDAKFPNGWTI